VSYDDGDALQRGLHAHGSGDHLLLLEHPHVYTLGTRGDPEHVLRDPSSVGAGLVQTDRGGDVTYHGPGQLVGYPVVTLPDWRNGMHDVVGYVRRLEVALRAALGDFGLAAECREGLTGVWLGDEKVAAIGVKVAGGRTRHGFALNVDPDLSMFGHIVACGLHDKGVTSLARVLGDQSPSMAEVVDVVAARFAETFGYDRVERHDVEGHHPHRSAPGPSTPDGDHARPEWMRVRADLGPGYRDTKRLMRSLALHTVCEEAGCPNIFECWADRTATFMILGERCTRACRYCLVDTRRPLPPDYAEPARVADAVVTLGLDHVVVTSVARDDLPDGGAGAFVATITAIRERSPATRIEVLIPDCKGSPGALATVFDAAPDVLNHNLETVARLQRVARPSAGYARSLAVLARAKAAGLLTKSGLILGLGETDDEARAAIFDLRSVGVDILTVGQYLRPSAAHLPVARWWGPEEFESLAEFARGLGFAHVESGPLVRSSYHAKRAAASVAQPVSVGAG
jgi:lipoic acid synthetase